VDAVVLAQLRLHRVAVPVVLDRVVGPPAASSSGSSSCEAATQQGLAAQSGGDARQLLRDLGPAVAPDPVRSDELLLLRVRPRPFAHVRREVVLPPALHATLSSALRGAARRAHRSRHCLPTRPGRFSAITDQLRGPCCATIIRTCSSSCTMMGAAQRRGACRSGAEERRRGGAGRRQRRGGASGGSGRRRAAARGGRGGAHLVVPRPLDHLRARRLQRAAARPRRRRRRQQLVRRAEVALERRGRALRRRRRVGVADAQRHARPERGRPERRRRLRLGSDFACAHLRGRETEQRFRTERNAALWGSSAAARLGTLSALAARRTTAAGGCPP